MPPSSKEKTRIRRGLACHTCRRDKKRCDGDVGAIAARYCLYVCFRTFLRHFAVTLLTLHSKVLVLLKRASHRIQQHFSEKCAAVPASVCCCSSILKGRITAANSACNRLKPMPQPQRSDATTCKAATQLASSARTVYLRTVYLPASTVCKHR